MFANGVYDGWKIQWCDWQTELKRMCWASHVDSYQCKGQVELKPLSALGLRELRFEPLLKKRENCLLLKMNCHVTPENRVKLFVQGWFFLTVTKSLQCHQYLLPLDLWLPECPAPHSTECVFVQPDWGSSSISASYESDSSRQPLRAPLGRESSLWMGLENRACPSGHKSTSKASSYLQRAGSPPPPTPWWFTAPTEARLGTATVSAPGPLSGGQDELFAEDIQMYKEQIRLTQSSFAPRDRKKRKRKGGPGDFKKTPLPRLLEWVKGSGEWKQPCVFKVLIHNLFL